MVSWFRQVPNIQSLKERAETFSSEWVRRPTGLLSLWEWPMSQTTLWIHNQRNTCNSLPPRALDSVALLPSSSSPSIKTWWNSKRSRTSCHKSLKVNVRQLRLELAPSWGLDQVFLAVFPQNSTTTTWTKKCSFPVLTNKWLAGSWLLPLLPRRSTRIASSSTTIYWKIPITAKFRLRPMVLLNLEMRLSLSKTTPWLSHNTPWQSTLLNLRVLHKTDKITFTMQIELMLILRWGSSESAFSIVTGQLKLIQRSQIHTIRKLRRRSVSSSWRAQW